MQAFKNFIFIKELPSESKLILPPVFQKQAQEVKRGIVKACGPKSHVNAGETIVFSKWEDNTVRINGEDLLIIKPNSVFAVEK